MTRLITILFLLYCFRLESATINVACENNAISNAILVTAQEGDTVVIGAGDIVLTNEIDINRNISFTIKGSGTNQTTIRSSGTSKILYLLSTSSNVFTISDMNVVGAGGNDYGISVGGKGLIHVYNIKMTNIVGRGISYTGGYGCADHNTLIGGVGYLQCVDVYGIGYGSWTNTSSPLGTTNVVCIEDNYMKGSGGNGFVDSYNGARVLFRHNFCDGYSPIGGHGYDSDAISINTWEIYDNIFTNQGSDALLSVWRGGTGVEYSNKWYGTSYNAIPYALGYYRSSPTNHTYDTITGYLLTGIPGSNYVLNFNNYTSFYPGTFQSVNGVTNGTKLICGFTSYTFTNNITAPAFANVNWVLIGSDVAHSITNLYNAINLGTGNATTYTNASAAMTIGTDMIATGLDTTNLYLKNALDGTNAYGYPANMQEGVLTSYPLTGTNFVNNQTVWPMWFGSNTFNDVLVDFNLATLAGGGPLIVTNLIKMGRDISNGIPPLATYTPLIYPHPLVAVGVAVGPALNVGTLNVGTLKIGQ